VRWVYVSIYAKEPKLEFDENIKQRWDERTAECLECLSIKNLCLKRNEKCPLFVLSKLGWTFSFQSLKIHMFHILGRHFQNLEEL
jgi:hypothetical protein